MLPMMQVANRAKKVMDGMSGRIKIRVRFCGEWGEMKKRRNDKSQVDNKNSLS
jgi:hypothetical protein